ncbi:MAG: phosphoribosylanthranilate isomerase [Anaerolineae bacterium]|nr:phosphoribosylanthranilate isomerase [Anaerolineae bacterium]
MKIQIYTMQTPDEARAVIAAGVDHIGITPSECGLPGEISLATARAIVEAATDATTVALSVEADLDAIVAMVNAVQPDILHLCGLAGAVPPAAVAELRTRLPGVAIMQAISVAGPAAIQTALAYQDVAEYLILDTQAPDIDGIGASGQTHDWAISRAIVEQSHVPVILAGGLSPENVAESIHAVRPWGVDSLTHTNTPLPGGGFRKDIDRVVQFVTAARAAAEEDGA